MYVLDSSRESLISLGIVVLETNLEFDLQGRREEEKNVKNGQSRSLTAVQLSTERARWTAWMKEQLTVSMKFRFLSLASSSISRIDPRTDATEILDMVTGLFEACVVRQESLR